MSETMLQGDEVYVTAAQAIPYVGWVVTAVKIVDGILNFGREGETEKAIRLLNERVAELEQAVRDIDDRLSELERRVAQGENRARLRSIAAHQLEFIKFARDLITNPEDASDTAANALDRLRVMFNDEDLWLWNDILGKPHDAPSSWRAQLPYFKGVGLPTFAVGTMVWALAAATHISRGGARQIHQPGADELLSWIATRTDWKQFIMPPVSIAERFRAAINVEIVISSKYVTANGNCEYAIAGLNYIDRTHSLLRAFDIYFGQGLPDTMCTVDSRIADIDEAMLEDESPYLKILNGIEDAVSRIRHRGTLADPFIGQFPNETYHNLTLYGIEPSGQLRRFQLETTTALAKPPTVTQIGGVLQTGWQSFAEVFGTYDDVMYAFSNNGAIDWYRNVDFAQGPNGWRGPNRVRAERGVGWLGDENHRYVNGGSGTFYLLRSYTDVDQDGFRFKRSLELAVHGDPSNGAGVFRDNSLVAQEFKSYPTLIGGGEGVLFGIDEDGDLYWLKHSSWPNAGTQLEGPVQIGHGWNGFARVLALGEGFIAGIYPSGEMMLYHFQQWRWGPRNENPIWHGPVRVPGTQWRGFPTLIPMVGSKSAPVN